MQKAITGNAATSKNEINNVEPVINLLATMLLREYYHVLETHKDLKGVEEEQIMTTFMRNVHANLLKQWEAFIIERSAKFKGNSVGPSSMQPAF